MSVILDENTLFNDIHFENIHGLSASSQGSLDFATSPYVTTTHLVPLNTTIQVTLGFNTYFKLQGFNAATGQYEIWHCMNTPVLTPPSGHNLQNVSVISTWTDR